VPPAPGRRFLVLHGWQHHRPPDHWAWWLTETLRERGEQVLYPQLPDPDHPRLTAWLETFAAEWAQLGRGQRVVVAHSLGCLLWLRAAAEGLTVPPADRVLLVAPPSPEVTRATPEMAEFDAPLDAVALRRSSRDVVRLACSDADVYSTEGTAAEVYGRPLGLDVDLLPGARHLSDDDGYGSWPAVLGWCLDPATLLTPR
jgi:predicted alpha/beta hydrolase family esterase